MRFTSSSETRALSGLLMQNTFDRIKGQMPGSEDQAIIREMYRRWEEQDLDARASGNRWLDFIVPPAVVAMARLSLRMSTRPKLPAAAILVAWVQDSEEKKESLAPAQ